MRLFRARQAPPPPPPIVVALGQDARLEQWRQLTLDGNVALERRDDVPARQLFEEALAVAEALMASAIAASPALPEDRCVLALSPLLHGMACNNVVELARLQGDRETAGIYLYRRALGLISVIESQAAPLELRTRCLLHLTIASGALYEYFEEAGMWDAARSFSARANAAMFSVQREQAARSGAPLPEDPFA